MEVYSLLELNQYIKQVIALNFVDTLWISCEISSFNESRGHAYLDLVEKDETTDQVKAMISAVIWFRDFSFLRKKLGPIADKVLKEGMQVKLKVEVDFHERFGMKLVIKDIDPSYTYGQLAIQREKVIEQLRQEGRMNLNNGIIFPTLTQRIAVISSDTAAGYQDFIQQLQQNQYGYAFKSQLFPAAMQGQRTEMEVVSQLKDIASLGTYDVVVITRGGGSKLDLSSFDSYGIAKQISEMPIPVITGIGHDIDLSIADMVSSIALKTPTAVANFLIDHHASFENLLYDQAIKLKLAVQQRFKNLDEYLNQFRKQLKVSLDHRLSAKLDQIQNIDKEILTLLKSRLKRERDQLANWEQQNRLIAPDRLLKKGYSIVRFKGKLIDSVESIKEGDQIETTLVDGAIQSIVKGKSHE